MKLVKTSELKEYMVLARNIYQGEDRNSLLLLKKGQILLKEHINRLLEENIEAVYVRSGKYDDMKVQSLLTTKEIAEAVKEIQTVYERNNISSEQLMNSDFDKLEDVSNLIVKQLKKNNNLQSCVFDLKSYDDYTYHHCLSVACLSLAIGIGLGFDEEKMKRLGLSALLHDIGKTMVDAAIINKPTSLSKEEFEIIKHHPSFGGEYLKKHIILESEIYGGVFTHHEKYDGSGYPLGLEGKDIPEFGRIIAVADVYDALTSKRSYREPWSNSEAYEYIIGNVDLHFDEECINAFASVVMPYPVGSIVILSNGEKAQVIQINKGMNLRPIVQLLDNGEIIDLGKGSRNIVINNMCRDELYN